MFDVLEVSTRNVEKAHSIIRELQIQRIMDRHNATANLVGSVETGLIMDHLDIDFHIYTDELKVPNSFSLIGEIADSSRITSIQYGNLLKDDDECLEWHLSYVGDDKAKWQIDIIHIQNGSRYAGKFERVARRINEVMTGDHRRRILEIKHEAFLRNEKAIGIEVYKSVLRDNISTYEGFVEWKSRNVTEGIVEWEP